MNVGVRHGGDGVISPEMLVRVHHEKRCELLRPGVASAPFSIRLAVYKITGTENRRLMRLARTLDQPGRLETSLDGLSVQLTLRAFEAEAKRITKVGALVIPELVQTPDYARARLESGGLPPESIDSLMTVDVERRAIVTWRTAPGVQVVLDEAALTRPIGGHAVMAGQVRHLRSFFTATVDLFSKALGPLRSLDLLAGMAYRHAHVAENTVAPQVGTGRSPPSSPRTC